MIKLRFLSLIVECVFSCHCSINLHVVSDSDCSHLLLLTPVERLYEVWSEKETLPVWQALSNVHAAGTSFNLSERSRLHHLILVSTWVTPVFVTVDLKLGSTATTQRQNLILGNREKSREIRSSEQIGSGAATVSVGERNSEWRHVGEPSRHRATVQGVCSDVLNVLPQNASERHSSSQR